MSNGTPDPTGNPFPPQNPPVPTVAKSNLGTILSNVWTSPKSTLTAVALIGVLAGIYATKPPTNSVGWAGFIAAASAAVVKFFSQD